MFSFAELLQNKQRPLVMGILNITPDSFSDGGESCCLNDALKKLEMLQEQGADIIDIGACSTAPMNEIASCETELRRLAVLPELVKASCVPLSIDTFRTEVAEFALECGVSVVNDESGCFSDTMAELVRRYGAGWVFMHTGGETSAAEKKYNNGVVADVVEFFNEMKAKATAFGLEADSLCYDCGIGFGKTRSDDLTLLANCSVLSGCGTLLVGASRKRIIGELTGKDAPSDRVNGSVGAAAVLTYTGASVLRVHDVLQTLDAVKVAAVIKKGCI